MVAEARQALGGQALSSWRTGQPHTHVMAGSKQDINYRDFIFAADQHIALYLQHA
jgi:hypothetical protein